jgi:hypothetical protein
MGAQPALKSGVEAAQRPSFDAVVIGAGVAGLYQLYSGSAGEKIPH